MNDNHEIKCILSLIYALRSPSCENNSSNETNIQKETEGDPSVKNEESYQEKQKHDSPIALPDAVIRDGILSFRPFRPFKVILIRGDNDEITWNNRNYKNHGKGGLSLRKKREYSLTFGSNRGPLRFEVIELPYLPPKNNNNGAEAETYNAADGVIISCYISRFFEFCDRYGYKYASSSIIEDVTKRRIERQVVYPSQDNNNEQIPQPDRKRARKETKPNLCNDYPRSIVLCANNVDITHAGARLSSVVFRESMGPTTASSTTSTTGGSAKPPTTFIENPRHPFSSLVKSLTSDDGLEFINVTANNGKEERVGRMDSSKTTISAMHSEPHLMPEKSTWTNDDDLHSWGWLRAQVLS